MKCKKSTNSENSRYPKHHSGFVKKLIRIERQFLLTRASPFFHTTLE